MFSRERRVPTELFDKILRDGHRSQTGHFSLMYITKLDTLPARLTIAVPKKLVRTAVGRNAFKRKARSLLKNTLSDLIPGIGVVIVPRSGALELENGAIILELTQLLEKNQLISK